MNNAIDKATRKSHRRNLPVIRQQPEAGEKRKENPTPVIAFLTSYPPRECGIATYSEDLIKALRNKFGKTFRFSIYPLESGTDSLHTYSRDVHPPLNTDWEIDYLQASHAINSNPRIGLVMVQHEFGLFRKNEEAFLEFLEFLDKPLLITFHSVIPHPDDQLRAQVTTMAKKAATLVVMTGNSAEILIRDYQIAPDKITVIPHGTHLVAYEAKDTLKEKYGLQGRKILSTFGLLGPGKSIETTLDALPGIVSEYPEVLFLIIGRTHPNLVKEKGEAYREYLTDKVKELGLEANVRFINQFVPLENLLEYLQLTDIYLFTSKDPNQAVSGTFVYAMSCGCPIISTPIPHAMEVLKNGAGIIFDFQDSRKLYQGILDLLRDDKKCHLMRMNGLHTSVRSSWENIAIAHAILFGKTLETRLKLQFRKPPIDLSHLIKMTTGRGIIQFAKINDPDIESGYTLDDNARALIAMCQYYRLTKDTSALLYLKVYAHFVFSCIRYDGTILNYVDKDIRFTDQNDNENLEDASGRALWSLGYLLSVTHLFPKDFQGIEHKALFAVDQLMEAIARLSSPRAMAFAIKGLYYYNLNSHKNPDYIKLAGEFADRLEAMYCHEAHGSWKWFEGYLTYANSMLPHALLMAYSLTGNTSYREIARESMDFLLSKLIEIDSARVISNKGWLMRDEEAPTDFIGGEQPIDVAYTVRALHYFHKIFPESGYGEKVKIVFNWFMGANALNQIVYNPCTGGCYDGLEKNHVNLNQGAESTICYLLARLTLEEPEER